MYSEGSKLGTIVRITPTDIYCGSFRSNKQCTPFETTEISLIVQQTKHNSDDINIEIWWKENHEEIFM